MSTDAPPVLAQLNLVVADMVASVAFYRRLGLTIDDSNPWSAHHIDVRIARQMVDVVGGDVVGAVAVAVAALIGHQYPEAGGDERGDLATPSG
jgi:catechol 2,3-dioxygenase-like lactoylglutathione lyase family enzyme